MALEPGSRIGPYEIVGLLGAGGMGDVYRARDARLSREVAVKALRDGSLLDPDRKARFDREARTLASLNHPHIATLYGLEDAPVDDPSRSQYLILELVEGGTAHIKIKDDKIAFDIDKSGKAPKKKPAEKETV